MHISTVGLVCYAGADAHQTLRSWLGGAQVVLEDDLLPSPDFIEFFEQGAKLMSQDDTVFVVSAWNDNGHVAYASNEVWRLDTKTWSCSLITIFC